MDRVIKNSNKKVNKASKQWSNYYKSDKSLHNYYPENFVERIFVSKYPIQFLDHNYIGKNILDLGCGHGRNIPFLFSLDLIVSGLEVSNTQIKVLKKTFPHMLFFTGTADNLPFEDNFYNYVLACNSIYYIDNLETGFEKHILEVKRVLKKDGYFIVSMLGEKHTIFYNAEEVQKGYYLVKNDFLNFRNGILIRRYNKKDDLKMLFPGFNLQFHGEIVESVNNKNRHLHYFVLKNN